MKKTLVATLFAASTLFTALPATAGPLDPDCTPEKAAKDTAKGATGIGDGDKKKPLSGDGDRKKDKDKKKD